MGRGRPVNIDPGSVAKGAALVAIDISAVERETGISKDTLRVWERRYGFPVPGRDANGERTYPPEQVERLRTIRRLMDGGSRPGAILSLTDSELATLLGERLESADSGVLPPKAIRDLTLLLEQRRIGLLQSRLAASLLRLGMQRFVTEIAAPLTVEVGELWVAGRISIADEHRYTDFLQQLIRGAMRPDKAPARRPRVLLTTLPGEPHGLGLLMTQAWLNAQGVECICLGTQTPAGEVATAALDYEADVVGVSFSGLRTVSAARAVLVSLRALLDPSIALWAGGGIWRDARKKVPGTEYIADFEQLGAALKRWN
jgi:DNA-binding transcriptional MerR regulator/methylmalonyl-CoA mutase cobalamin-binding subunit